MCGRYVLWGVDLVGSRFLIVDPTLGFRSHFNIAPQTENPIIVAANDGNHIQMMQWGLVPHWAKDMNATHRPINARAESLADKPMFRSLLKNKRCLVPASGFYEWKKEGTRKVPFYIHLHDDPVFAFAGLYDVWHDASGETHQTYTIITTDANELMIPIHNRMPVILRKETEQEWLSSTALGTDVLKIILSPYPAEEMIAYPVSSRVNTVTVDEEDLIKPST
jgi:putative SOS response-associated peptidase YedK